MAPGQAFPAKWVSEKGGKFNSRGRLRCISRKTRLKFDPQRSENCGVCDEILRGELKVAYLKTAYEWFSVKAPILWLELSRMLGFVSFSLGTYALIREVMDFQPVELSSPRRWKDNEAKHKAGKLVLGQPRHLTELFK